MTEPKNKIRFAETLRYLREQSGLSQAKLARMLHVTSAVIYQYENGKAEPSFSMLQAIADLWGIHPGDLLDGVR